MAIIGASQFLERMQFFNGERLFATDLQALESFNREMRWLHNQSLHQAGIGSGYAVIGNVGDRQVTIAPGYALDACGREIILTETQVQQIPPVADNGSGGSVFYDLTVSYPDDSKLKPSQTRDGVCTTAGVVRLREAPVFCWVRLNDDPTNPQPIDATLKARIKNNLFILLARVEIFNCQLKQPVSTALRINARPGKQLRIAAGIATQTSWTKTAFGSTGSGVILAAKFAPFAYSTSVDTSAAAFQATPSYTARIAGPREFLINKDYYIADALLTITDDSAGGPTPQGFTIQIFPIVAPLNLTGGQPLDVPASEPNATAVTPVAGASADPNAATTLDTILAGVIAQWNVAWMGIEG